VEPYPLPINFQLKLLIDAVAKTVLLWRRISSPIPFLFVSSLI